MQQIQQWLCNETKSGGSFFVSCANVNVSPARICFVFKFVSASSTYGASTHVSSFFNGAATLRLRGVNLETSAVLLPSECLFPGPRTNMVFPFRRHHKLMTMESRWRSGFLYQMIPFHPTQGGLFFFFYLLLN